MPRIAVIAGSTRDGSYNRALATLATRHLAAHGADVTPIDLATLDLPLYGEALELRAFPRAARALKATLQAHDGLLVVTPEYNGSLPALLKNAIDWASRPTDGEGPVALSAFRGKAAAIMSASVSPFGGLRALAHLRQILGTIQMLVIPDQLSVPLAHAAFDGAGALIEPLPAALVETIAARLVDVADRLAA